MIINNTSDVKTLGQGDTQDSVNMSLDMESAHILMTMLSKNLYSDSIGSTIRETASNALDSHRKAGVDKPIIVSFGANSQGNYEFSVQDFGTGLDDLDVENIISKYGKSTKRDSNEFIGAMGLGFKAPLSYTSSFYFTCRKDNIERKYMMSEGEKGNTIELLFESVTTEDNGVIVTVPIEYKDRYTFIEKIKEQLSYFENVYFNVDSVNNDFNILKEVDFQLSELSTDHKMHICLNNVYYPIDYNKLGISAINIGIGLRFSLSDGLFPTPSRETLIYSQNTIKLILDKIKVVSNFLINKYNEDMKETENIKEIFNYYKIKDKYLNLGKNNYSINSLINYSQIKIIKPSFKGVKKLDLGYLWIHRDYLIKEYVVTHVIANNRVSAARGVNSASVLKENNFPVKNIYSYSRELSTIKKEYLKSLIGNRQVYLVKKRNNFKLKNRILGGESYHSILDLKNHPKENWRQIIQEFQLIQKIYTDQFIDLDKIEPTQEWLDSRKRTYTNSGRKAKIEGTISCKTATHLQRSNGDRKCKFEADILVLKDLYKQPNLYIYGEVNNTLELDALFYNGHYSRHKKKSTNKERLKLLTVSSTEYKKLEKLNIHNLISYKRFMEGDNKVFKRLVTAQLINKLISKYKNVFNNLSIINKVSPPLYDKLEFLVKYREKNWYHISEDVGTILINLAETNKLFDGEIYSDYIEMSQTLDKLKFMNILLDRFRNTEEVEKQDLFEILIDLFKYNKYKIDLKYYSKPIKEEEIEEILDATS